MSVAQPSMLHVDLDAFYASVEQLLDPRLRGLPVVVGGTGRRGVVSAASYEARRFGVHSAMPTERARRLCPDGVFLAPRTDTYRELSAEVFAILESFTPLVEPISIDEAFLDVAGVRRLFGSGPEIARRIRERVHGETGLTCSVGVATTKLVAKLASGDAKPDGSTVVAPGEELSFLHRRPVGDLWGVGPATRERLERLGVRTVGDLARVPLDSLVRSVGAAQGAHLHALAWNDDERTVTSDRAAKSISAEETFPDDVADGEVLRGEVRHLAHRVGARLREGRLRGRTVTLKVRSGDFRTATRSATLEEPTDHDEELARAALDLLASVEAGAGLRLVGVGASNLQTDRFHQQRLPFGSATDRRSVDAAVDAVRERFGPGALR